MLTGKELGQYKILAEIGRGGMGVVYKAYQISLNREVALKVLPANLAIDESLVKRFHREAESAARLCHPNIVQIFDISEIDGTHFFAMEYLKGETLSQKIQKQGPLPIKEAVQIVMAVADALNYSHGEGIIHRDIKPGNIMIDQYGHVKVTDFGLARAMESSRLTMTGTIIGTPEYMSPEQALGEDLDSRSDLYSLGIVLYEAVTNRIPFEASTPFAIAQKQIYEPVPLPTTIRPEISKTLEAIILKATNKERNQRYQSGDEFRKDLEIFSSGGGIERITPTVAVTSEAAPLRESGARKSLPKRIRWGRVALVTILLLAVLAVLAKPLRDKLSGVAEVKEQLPEKHVEEIIAPSPPPVPEASEGEADKIIEEARHLINQGLYSEAVSELEDVMEKFPRHPQANLIPQWIDEIKAQEAGKRFEEAQHLAQRGETVQAILRFNEIAGDYPGTKWQFMAKGKVEELERALKEGEAEKIFLEAQNLQRNNKFIEATQLYQSIISRFPGTPCAEKAGREINKLKEAQARLKDRIAEDMKKEFKAPDMEPQMREPSLESGQPLEEAKNLIEDIKKRDLKIKGLIKGGDEKKLAYYLWTQHKPDLEEIAQVMGIPEDKAINMPFSHVISRYLLGDSRAFEMIPMVMERRQEEFRPEEEKFRREDSPEDKCVKKFREKTRSDKTLQKYIDRRNAEGLWYYLMSKYYREVKEISKELDRPFRDTARDLSERLVHERDQPEMKGKKNRD